MRTLWTRSWRCGRDAAAACAVAAVLAVVGAVPAAAQFRILNGGHADQGTQSIRSHMPQVPVPPPPAAADRLPNPSPARIQQIIRQFTANEGEDRALLAHNYVYTENIDMEVLDSDGDPTGQYYRQTDDIQFSPTGRRRIVCTWCPNPTLQNIQVTEDDIHDFFNMDMYAVDLQDLSDYDIRYMDHEKLEDLTAYRFRIRPKKMLKGQRYFAGTVWVDDHYFQVVKSEGKAVPDQFDKHGVPSNIFLPFTTYRQLIDGKYWFPVYTSTDSPFPDWDGKTYAGSTYRIKMVIRFTNYRRFGTSIQIHYKPPSTNPPPKPH